MITKNGDGKNALTNTSASMGGAYLNVREFEVWEVIFSD